MIDTPLADRLVIRRLRSAHSAVHPMNGKVPVDFDLALHRLFIPLYAILDGNLKRSVMGQLMEEGEG